MKIGKEVLEVGSNLFELIEFAVTPPKSVESPLTGEQQILKPSTFGVNVAKVREVIRLPQIVPCMTKCPEVMGVFNLRGLPVPVINLAMALGQPAEPITPSSQVIVTEFAKRIAGFVVSETRRIRRVSWDKVLPPSSEAFNSITGMMLIENNDFLFIIDFERILVEIEGKAAPQQAPSRGSDRGSSDGSSQSAAPAASKPAGDQKMVLVVDDSSTARKAITDMLRSMNLDVIEYPNGEAAWQGLKSGEAKVELIISDVEMPQLDGYSLVKRIREDGDLKKLPIILHSSLSGSVSEERALQAGANAYVTKFNKRGIVDALKSVMPGWEAKTA